MNISFPGRLSLLQNPIRKCVIIAPPGGLESSAWTRPHSCVMVVPAGNGSVFPSRNRRRNSWKSLRSVVDMTSRLCLLVSLSALPHCASRSRVALNVVASRARILGFSSGEARNDAAFLQGRESALSSTTFPREDCPRPDQALRDAGRTVAGVYPRRCRAVYRDQHNS